MKKLLLIFLMFFVSAANANVLDDCLKQIVSKKEIWQDMLFDKTNGIFNFLSDNDELTDDIVQNNKSKVYALLGKDIQLVCPDKIVQIAKIGGRKEIPFTHNKKEYAFDFDVTQMFDYIDNIRTAILVINKRNLSSGKVLKLTDIPKSKSFFSPYHFFSDECSDHVIADNLDDDAAVNVAGQAVFQEYGGSNNEFFLDFAEGNDRRAFPGLVLMDKTWSGKEQIVSYLNPIIGMQRVQQFAEKLKNSACANQGLSVYLVALDVKRDTSGGKKDAWSIGLISGAGAAATTAGIALWTGAAASVTVPVVGWIVAGVLASAATAVTLIPAPIEKIDQVMILDGPYNL